jgi:hypothetical protein
MASKINESKLIKFLQAEKQRCLRNIMYYSQALDIQMVYKLKGRIEQINDIIVNIDNKTWRQK